MSAKGEDPGPPAPLSAVYAVMRHELRTLLYAPLSYLFLFGFLAALSACVFLIADFYASDEASIRLMLVFLPWVAMILVPALAMGMWAGQAGDRGTELAMTLPVGPGPLVVGKFLAGYAVLLLALLFTLPFAGTVLYLGDPDAGALAGGYLGSALLLGTCFAVALFCAALAREQVGAFVLALACLFVLQLLGWDALGRVLRGALPAEAVDVMALYSPSTWLRDMGQGWVEMAGLAYFATLSAAALFGTALVVGHWRRGPVTLRRLGRGLAAGAALLGGTILVVALLSQRPVGLDLTAEREFTLHGGTLEILERLPEGSEATLYWSAGEGSVPAAIKSHARRVRNLLETLSDRSDGRLLFREIDPRPDSDQEIEAQSGGLRPVPMSSGDRFYLGLTVAQGGRATSIPYLDPRRERLFEYDLAVALNNLTRERPPRVGVISPLLPSSVAAGRREGLSFIEELKRAYDIAVIPHFKETLPQGLDALLVIDATILRAELLYEIDQFVMGGGGLVIMIDPFLRFNRASNAVNPSPDGEVNDISDLLLRYGVRYTGEVVVGDATLASPVADRDGAQMSFPFWMRIGKDGLSDAHPATADLNEVFFVDPGALDLVEPERAVALVTTTGESAGYPRADYGGKSPRELAAGFAPDGRTRILAAALRGPFASAFGPGPQGEARADHRATSDGEPLVFAVADVDWLFDPFALQQAEVSGRTVVRPLNDNLSLLLNMVEYASGDPALVAIRSRGRLQRPFTRVAELFKRAEGELRKEETALTQKGAELETRITEAVRASGATDLEGLPADLRDDLRALYEELVGVRRDLREVRRRIRSDIERLGRRVMVVNLLAGPLLVIALAVFLRWRRGRPRGL